MGFKKVILFYKRLLEPGGAERLLLEEYRYFKEYGYDIDIVTYEYNPHSLFDESIDLNDVIVIGDSLSSIYKLSRYLSEQVDAHIISASGDIDIYLATLCLNNIDYSLHIHHPSYMTFKLDPKYSIFQINLMPQMIKNNFGAKNIVRIYRELSFFQKLSLNIKSFFIIKALQKSKNNFVMSKYAKEEKKILYDINCDVECGAIENVKLDYELKDEKLHQKYSKYDNVLISICRLDKNKRVDVIIKAFSLYLEHYPNSMLLVGGTGPESENLKDLVNELNLNKNVEFLGFISEEVIYDYYYIADLSISIDWADYRITSFEALSVGTKVLMASEAEYDQVLKEGNYIFIAKARPQIIAKEIEYALISKPLIDSEKLVKILENYTWKSYTKRLLEIIEKR